MLAVGLAIVASLIAAPAASANIYWGDASKGTIGRATNEGGSIEPNFITGLKGPTSVTVDQSHIYWGSESAKAIGRANIDGSGVNPKFISTGTEVSDVAVTGSYIFWSALLNSSIGRAKIDGTGPTNNLITGIAVPCGVAVDSGHLYWLSQASPVSRIGRSSFGGLEKDEDFATLKLGFQCGLALDPLYLYWGDRGLGNGVDIGRADVSNGGSVDNTFIGGSKGPCGVAVFDSKLYWANVATNTIARANVDSSGVNQSFIATGGTTTCGIAVDALAPSPVGPPAPPPPTPGPDLTKPKVQGLKGPGKGLARGKAKFRFRSNEPGSRFVCKLDARKTAPCASPKSFSGLVAGRHIFKVWAIDQAGNTAEQPGKRGSRVPD